MKTYNDFADAVVTMLTKQQKKELLEIIRNAGDKYGASGLVLAMWAVRIEKTLTNKTEITLAKWLNIIDENTEKYEKDKTA